MTLRNVCKNGDKQAAALQTQFCLTCLAMRTADGETLMRMADKLRGKPYIISELSVGIQ